MARNDDILLQLVKSVSSIETTLTSWGELPQKVANIEAKVNKYENQVAGGWRVVMWAAAIVGVVWTALTFVVENVAPRIMSAMAAITLKQH